MKRTGHPGTIEQRRQRAPMIEPDLKRLESKPSEHIADRGEKLRVEVFPEVSPKLEKPLKYASGRNVPVLAILGEDEQARGEVTVRDLQTRKQEAAPRATAADWIAKRVRIS